MTKATEILMEEHRTIERVINALEIAADRLATSQSVRPGFFLQAADFIREFADGIHHRKEEGVLFEEMVARGLPKDGGPIAVMLEEHDQGRRFVRGMKEAAERLAGGDSSSGEAVVQNAQGYIALLRQHIAKEDTILYPMADQLLPPEEQERLAEAYVRVEQEDEGEGKVQRYLDLAEALEKEIGG